MKLFDPANMMEDDEAFRQIIEQNYTSMLYCVRSKEVCVEILRMFVKNSTIFEDLKMQVLKIDRISKVQTKKAIFNELPTTLSVHSQ